MLRKYYLDELYLKWTQILITLLILIELTLNAFIIYI